MKKRSLVAALAMLVVSAIVLTSSTYAWFAASDKGTVTAISASVANANGALTLKAKYNGTDTALEKVTLGEADFPKVADNLTPISLYLDSEGAVTTSMLKYEGSTFSTGGAPVDTGASAAHYQHYSFDVKYVNGTAVEQVVSMKPTFTTGTQYCYGLIIVKDSSGTSAKEQRYFFNNGGYAPVTVLTGNVEDANANFIIDDEDINHANATRPADMGSNYTLATSGVPVELMRVAAPAEGVANVTNVLTVEVYVWAEGQDPQCITGAASGTAAMDFEFTAAQAA